MQSYLSLLLFISSVWGQTAIAVFDLDNNGLNKSDIRLLTDRLQSELVKIGGYTIVERKKINEILNEQKLTMSGIVDDKHLINIGKMVGAKLIVLGNIGKVASIYTISARLVDAETSEILKSANYDAGNSLANMLTMGMNNVAFQLIGKKNDSLLTYNDDKKTLKNQNAHKDLNIENDRISIIKIKKRLSSDGSNKVYVTYRQKISYKPTEIMIDWLDVDGIPFDGDKKYTKSKVKENEIRVVSFYIPNESVNYRVWLKD